MTTAQNNSTARIAGALKAIDALRQLERAAGTFDCDDTAAAYHQKRVTDASAFAATFGSLTPEQEGALIVVGEYIHTWLDAGQPNIDPGGWVPSSALTDEEARIRIAEQQAWMDAVDGKPAKDAATL